jgi:hypothetical protein
MMSYLIQSMPTGAGAASESNPGVIGDRRSRVGGRVIKSVASYIPISSAVCFKSKQNVYRKRRRWCRTTGGGGPAAGGADARSQKERGVLSKMISFVLQKETRLLPETDSGEVSHYHRWRRAGGGRRRRVGGRRRWVVKRMWATSVKVISVARASSGGHSP